MKKILMLLMVASCSPAPAMAETPKADSAPRYNVENEARQAEENTASMIETLYKRTSIRTKDVKVELEKQMFSAFERDSLMGSLDDYDFLEEDLPDIQAARISTSDARRHLKVPSMSQLTSGVAENMVTNPEDQFLDEWRVIRSGNAWIVGRPDEPMTYIDVRIGMILGSYGRVTSIWDSKDEFYLKLDSGERIEGRS